VDKLADYEDELRQLRNNPRQSITGNPQASASDSALATQQPPERPTTPNQNSMTSRLGSLLGSRKSQSNLSPGRATSPSPTPGEHTRRESDLEAALAKEQQLRQKAEGQASKLSSEVEDLSVTLFQQANEMVAAERKARAKLEERVEILEKRDGEKRKRLERLEGAVRRIERVRGLLDVP
jgi:chromosome segregation ATPase